MRIAMVSRMRGLGHYSLMVASEMRCEVYILCESDVSPERRGNIILVPCWNQGSFTSNILTKLKELRPDVVCFQHETYLFGTLLSALLTPWLLVRIRFQGMPIVLTMHGVVPARLFTQGFLRDMGLPGFPRVARFGYRMILNAIVAVSSAVLTTDGWLGRELRELTPLFRDKVTTLPLGVVANPLRIDQNEAKAKLGVSGRRVALYLGYLAFYKGIENLVRAAQLLHKWGTNWTVILAGGPPVSASGPNHDPTGFHGLREPREIPPNLRIEGFVPEDRIPAYMAAADVVVLPYKYLFSSSGPLSLALSYEKPVLLSEQFSVLVRDSRLIVEGNPEKLAHRIAQSYDDRQLATAARNLAEEWKAGRDWVAISKRYFSMCEQMHQRSPSKTGPFETADSLGRSQ